MSRTHLKLLSATALALFVTACGDGNQTPNTTAGDGNQTPNTTANPQTQKSLGQEINAISSDILAALQPPSFDGVTSKAEADAVNQRHLQNLKALQPTVTTEVEKDFLNLQIAAKEIAATSEQLSAAEIKTQSLAILQKSTPLFNKYIQTTELRNALIHMTETGFEGMYLYYLGKEKDAKGESLTPQEQAQKASNEKKMIALTKSFIALTTQAETNPTLAAELDALDKIGLFTKKQLADLEQSLAAEEARDAGLDLGSNTSLRRMRTGGSEGHADLTAFNLNGNAGSLHALPKNLYLQVSGSTNTLKNQSTLTGVAAYKINNTLVGVIHGHTNTHLSSVATPPLHETSAVVSQSCGNAFIEAQAGVIAGNIQGSRAMLSLGYDFKYVTPFIQTLYRNIHNTNHYSVYAGLEADVLNFATHAYTTTFNLNVKGGHNQNAAFIGQLAASANLTLNNGLGISNKLTLNEKLTPTVELGFSYTY
jgi:hypothetical protein